MAKRPRNRGNLTRQGGQLDSPSPRDGQTQPAQPVQVQPPPQGQQRQISAQFSAQMESYRGSVPPPTLVAQWEHMVPGAADRILTMVEKQEANRIFLEQTGIKAEVRSSYFGTGSSLAVALACIGTSAYLASIGHAQLGAGLTGTTLVSLVGVFVYGNRSRMKERIEKAKLMAQRIGRAVQPAPPQPGRK